MRPTLIGLALTALLPAAAFAQAPDPAPATASAPAATAKPASVESEAPRVYLEKITVEVAGKAQFDGSVEMEFTPVGGVGKTFEVRVLKNTGRKDVAKDLHKELTLAAGSGYKVKLSGDQVRISKGSSKSPNFAIVIKKLNLAGMSVLVKQG